MKKILLFTALLFAFVVSAQGVKPITYTEVVSVSDSTKSAKQLYASAKMWFTQLFKDPREVIILDDAENNILVGRGNIPYKSKIFLGSATREGRIYFDVTIACKDGRYKYDFTNFMHEGDGVNLGLITDEEFLSTMKGAFAGGPKNYKIKVTNELRDLIASRVLPSITSLKTEMDKKIITKEDW
ncbi:DUF4468 domain-containing protein [Empedobacter sp.]|uniref:DUF4468 domain-containing protein n=1 Tax=Empedobacter sp. TaxID=1927715 RepID=UPI00289DB45E|nr:DUF4468 domain-containing protein [Empedobacter sp.]